MHDIKKLKVSENMDHILLHIVFDDKFPYTPPFVRVVKPVINGGYVTAGGAICMELLTPQVNNTINYTLKKGSHNISRPILDFGKSY